MEHQESGHVIVYSMGHSTPVVNLSEQTQPATQVGVNCKHFKLSQLQRVTV